jgi:alkylated DNA repair dioxygenase AlkB
LRRTGGILTSLPEGFRYIPDFVTADEERTLVDHLEALAFKDIKMRGVVARRTAVHFGYDYGYDTWTIRRTDPPPPFLATLRERSAALIGQPVDALAQVLILRYPPGAGIGWHRDAPMFGPAVVGISLGAPAVMRLRRSGTTRGGERVALDPRSAYVIAGPARTQWQHSVPAVNALRYSITFRTVVEGTRRLEPSLEAS